jgi:hypothetical protein
VTPGKLDRNANPPIGRSSEAPHDVVERVRQSRLKKITLRLGIEQIAEARLVAKQTGQRYQAVLREWIAQGAADAQRRRRRSGGSR